MSVSVVRLVSECELEIFEMSDFPFDLRANHSGRNEAGGVEGRIKELDFGEKTEKVGQKRKTSTKDESNELEKPAMVARKNRLMSSLHPGFHTEKTEVKSWANCGKQGRLFSALVSDESTEMKLTGFDSVCDRFANLFQNGKLLQVTNFECRAAREQYRCTTNDKDILLAPTSTVHEIKDRRTVPLFRKKFTTPGWIRKK